jgi:hypothetical protein
MQQQPLSQDAILSDAPVGALLLERTKTHQHPLCQLSQSGCQ